MSARMPLMANPSRTGGPERRAAHLRVVGPTVAYEYRKGNVTIAEICSKHSVKPNEVARLVEKHRST